MTDAILPSSPVRPTKNTSLPPASVMASRIASIASGASRFSARIQRSPEEADRLGEQVREPGCRLAAALGHLGVVEGLIEDARGHVGAAGNPEHLDAQRPGRDH